MPNPSVQPAVSGNDLGLQAFLYVSGELESSEAASFERHLGEDQAAREAVCQAVRLCLTLASPTGAAPDPAYRERVRQRLRSWPSTGRIIGQARTQRGHPVIWGLLGAASALLVMLALQRPHSPAIPNDDPSSPVVDARPTNKVADDPDETPPAPPLEMASVWAELPNGEHLRTARDEELRRKIRAEELQQLATPHERRPRTFRN